MTLVLVVTHGGLGNQLFQTLYGELVCDRDGGSVRRVHIQKYAHGFGPSPALDTPPVSSVLHTLANLRLPKVFSRFGLLKGEKIHLPGTLLLDGYFQYAEQYERFSPEAIHTVIASLRQRLSITQPANRDILCHIRLGDFFGSEADQAAHLEARLSELPRGSDIVTNRDDLLVSESALQTLAQADCRHIPSAALSPEDLIALMAKYQRIVANDSTLALWAAVLGNGKIDLKEQRLRSLFNLLSQSVADPFPPER